MGTPDDEDIVAATVAEMDAWSAAERHAAQSYRQRLAELVAGLALSDMPLQELLRSHEVNEDKCCSRHVWLPVGRSTQLPGCYITDVQGHADRARQPCGA